MDLMKLTETFESLISRAERERDRETSLLKRFNAPIAFRPANKELPAEHPHNIAAAVATLANKLELPLNLLAVKVEVIQAAKHGKDFVSLGPLRISWNVKGELIHCRLQRETQ
jgi:hypothetical protein